ncbi:MAG: AAA family ATPase, partial [Oscillospiraceae bacterium]
MGIGIIICGLNGSGKSTLGKVLSEQLNFHFIDSEHLFFTEKNVYSLTRSHEEATQILMNEIQQYQNFVLASVKGEYGKQFLSFINYAIVIDVPKEIRLKRVQ